MGRVVVIYWLVAFVVTSSVHAANETDDTTSTPWTSYADEKDCCYISTADLLSNNIDVFCENRGYPFATAGEGEDTIKINNGEWFNYYCKEGYCMMMGQRVAQCVNGYYGTLPECFSVEIEEPVTCECTLVVICLSLALCAVITIWIITLGMCWRKLRSQSQTCHCKHSENDSMPLSYSLPSIAPEVPKRHSPPLPSPSLAMCSISASSLTDTPHPTTAYPNVCQETNGKPMDMMYEYVEPRVTDYYLEITS